MSRVLTLDYEHEHDYLLIGVHTTLEDFRLAYALNESLHISLERQKADIDFTDTANLFTLYNYECGRTFSSWSLISNKYLFVSKSAEETNLFAEETKMSFLIKERKDVDFFIKISGDDTLDTNKNLQNKLKQINGVMASYTINPNQLKSKDFLIF